MRSGILNIVFKSLLYYRKAALNQFIIVAILAAVITGSLLTGFSVRESLRNSAMDRLGNTGIMITSGIRFFNPGLADQLAVESGFPAIALLETNGFCKKFTGEGISSKTKIYGIDTAFFSFLGYKNIVLKPGEIAVNRSLSERTDIKAGDDIILNINLPSDIPSNSPFAPSSEASAQRVLRVAMILEKSEGGDFSPSINQVLPDNIFINISDLIPAAKGEARANRILVDFKNDKSETDFAGILKKVLTPADIGIKIRKVIKTGEVELISSRIFIDREIMSEILSAIPQGKPVITYLVNTLKYGEKSTPYSFVAAIDPKSYNGIDDGDKIVIDKWLAEDLGAGLNDTLILRWYAPGRIRELEEVTGKFVVSGVVGRSGIWADSLLMPEFPGIAGSKTCTDWNAGVEIKMDRIRPKDEDYWNKYRGTPKAFLSYNTGKNLWGNNFGPATSIRFPGDFSTEKIADDLSGRLNPGKCGFGIKNLRAEMIRAADQSVDFSTLFLSLGFFIIVACIFLLILAVSSYFDSRRAQVFTLFALGFKNRWIRKLLFLETSIIAASGSLAGILSGLVINTAIIYLLNSVWIGAVQSGTIVPYAGLVPLIAGFFITFIISIAFLFLRIRKFLRTLQSGEKGVPKAASVRLNLALLLISSILAGISAVLGTSGSFESTGLSFATGGFVFVTLVLLWRHIVISNFISKFKVLTKFQYISGRYYSFQSSRAVMPVLLIAAGLFAVIITGINRLQINERSTSNAGGTGGFKLWAETTAPVKEDLNSLAGRKLHGLDEPDVPKAVYVQARLAGGDDASCLNLNYVSSPPILGIDPTEFIKREAFSFGPVLSGNDKANPWQLLNRKPQSSCIFGFADQTVLEWGLKKKVGDTLNFRSETGELFNVIIAGGLKSSVFQGYLIIGEDNFTGYFPSIPGSSVLLIDCEWPLRDTLTNTLRNRFESYGMQVIPAEERLASFFRVTNTYLSVFTTLGGFGLILGVLGLGFVLRQNYNSRKREFALLMASGYAERTIRKYILGEQVIMLITGVTTGIISAFIATYPSISGGSGIPWISLLVIILAIAVTGISALLVSLRGISQKMLVTSLRRE